MTDQPKPPFYVLLAHSSLSGLPSGAPSNTLGHPVIQYHYADDSPLSLLPAHPDEHVLIFDHSTNPTVKSISKSLSVTGLKLEEAPGAAAEDEAGARNDTMYIIETTSTDQSTTAIHGDHKSAHSILTQYKNRSRNAILRKALLYPPQASNPDPAATTPNPNAQSPTVT
ncbi:hypothetical protein CVT26_004374 [Gymnopilus dilepis]|uniref:Uncharacterized protein n=1 Tax=Gymnopilus dilepis TaxID=231916 RepID=A0A409WDY4_9AGAR|nr:hypothetical protein CVT26_004374 [Gymnopilus dilepis]